MDLISHFAEPLIRMIAKSRGKCFDASVLALMLVCVGCGSTTGTVQGVVTIDGKNVALEANTRGTVIFQPAGGQGTTATGLLDAKGHFDLATGGMSQIRPGRYLVAISIVRLLPATEGAERGGERITPARYASTIDSGLQADVAPGENKFAFDLASADETTEQPNSATDASSADASSGDGAKATAEPESKPAK